MDIVLHILLAAAAAIVALFVAYMLFHYVLFLLVSHPRDASGIGHELNQFEQLQLVEWAPKPNDFLKHDDEERTYDDVFGIYRDEEVNYSACAQTKQTSVRHSSDSGAEADVADGPSRVKIRSRASLDLRCRRSNLVQLTGNIPLPAVKTKDDRRRH